MRKYLIRYKPFLLFLGTFFFTYILLTFLYHFFLDSYERGNVDAITRLVAQNADAVLSGFDKTVFIKEDSKEPFFTLYFHQKGLVRIVEGCNGISLIILFISFVVAFSGNLKNTLLFIFGGSLLIYVLNVLRIAILSVLIYCFPSQLHLLHAVLFPLIIYSVVFMLWIVWINKFSKYAK
ncbi:exosortase family protein XrtF [Flavobacterium sp. ZT3R18]|uniref:exosortase family protein XrtF n=1 Tax=Flavobacterium sp. ZT3R18 TaxID=2594429 RepID=UPI00117A498C|nr:exosortase family protein XrtF [Flavobacterium sp. ZT3R18]TRX38798.1 exosortase family protein XrtF [Flavobacterium sp. ZT3R18]